MSVDSVPISAVTAAYRRATTKANAIQAGACNGQTLLYAHSTFAVANSAFVAQLQIFAMGPLPLRLNAIRRRRMKGSSVTTRDGTCKDLVEVSESAIYTY